MSGVFDMAMLTATFGATKIEMGDKMENSHKSV